MVNEEKIFALLEKMYSKVSGIEDRLTGVEVEQHKLSQTVARMEVDNHDKFGALFDGQKTLFEQVSKNTELLNQHTELLNQHSVLHKQHSSQLNRLETKVDAISEKVGSHEVQLKMLKNK